MRVGGRRSGTCSTIKITDMAKKKNTTREFLNKLLKGRPQPSAPRSGYKASGSRYGNGDSYEIIVLIGPTTSGDEFQNTLVHELHHVAVAIASSLGIDLESETPAYIAGNSMRDLAGVVCELGCHRCN